MTTTRRAWTREDTLLVLHLYWRIPFGQQHARNARVIDLAAAMGRSSNSVAMKLNNFTSLDPAERARGVKGLQKTSALDRSLIAQFTTGDGAIVSEAEALWRVRVEGFSPSGAAPPIASTPRATEAEGTRRVRLGQDFFRRVVLENFNGRCALTGLATPELLVASHVVPWADDETRRVDPGNGIALNRLHDAAFDRHLITFDEDLRLVVGRRVRDEVTRGELAAAFLAYEGTPLAAPVRHALSEPLLAKHREVFGRVAA